MEGPTETVIVWSNLLTMTQPEIDSAIDVICAAYMEDGQFDYVFGCDPTESKRAGIRAVVEFLMRIGIGSKAPWASNGLVTVRDKRNGSVLGLAILRRLSFGGEYCILDIIKHGGLSLTAQVGVGSMAKLTYLATETQSYQRSLRLGIHAFIWVLAPSVPWKHSSLCLSRRYFSVPPECALPFVRLLSSLDRFGWPTGVCGAICECTAQAMAFGKRACSSRCPESSGLRGKRRCILW